MSKYIGLIAIMVILSVVSFFIGIKYRESLFNSKLSPVPEKCLGADIICEKPIDYCGFIPKIAYPEPNLRYSIVSGPAWSPNCHYTASALAIQGEDLWEGERLKQFLRDVPKGVFVYNDSTKKVTKVYSEAAFFDSWIDRENFTFSTQYDTKKYNYNVTSQQLTTAD